MWATKPLLDILQSMFRIPEAYHVLPKKKKKEKEVPLASVGVNILNWFTRLRLNDL